MRALRSAWLWLAACVFVARAADDPSGDQGPEKPRWDVSKPPGEPGKVAIDTRTGTWLGVDVSPDGETVVFDLLGDLYELPIAGGEARSLTSGMAWDMQPRYSPDGADVLFTSDRGGGDNLWILARGGGEPLQVSEESFRLLSSGDWTPDGMYVVGRKHFTSTRSLGAGEIWLYDRFGGDGVQLTKRQSEQKDLGEPALSPDGRYVYYSLDATPGSTFEYNKDSNAGIYAIERLDRSSGRIERMVGGPGGAARPTPHPDGRHLAYVRRIRGKTVLMLHDLRSGAERALWDGLERDHQETWAIHGVYPGMSWTPDGRSLVLWAQGRLWRVDVGDPAGSGPAKVVEIPFHVKDSREIRDAVRFPVQVAPEQFETRMIRDVRVSPDGGQVAFQALGVLWVKALPDGEPRRLTDRGDHFEHAPAWSPDGKLIAFVTWDDQELGSVQVIPARGGKSKALTTEPGHWFEPCFSPDGALVAARKGGGGYLTSARWSGDQGLYVIDRKTGAATRVSRSGGAPHFGPTSDRLYFLEDRASDSPGGSDSLDLKSVSLAPTPAAPGLASTTDPEVRVEAHAAMATAIRVSPDGRWLAFQEDYNAYLTPFVATGRTLEIGPAGGALPTVKLSEDAGDWLHFAHDAVHWSTGPRLGSAPIADAIARVRKHEPPGDAKGDGKKETEDEKPPEWPHADLSFRRPLARPSGVAALVGARLITMKGDEVIEDGTLVWKEDRLVAVGPRAEVRVPAGATVIEGKGRTVIPGLIDVHAHGPHASDGIVPEQNWAMYAALAFGVTTLHDPSHDTASIFASSEMQKAGAIVAPRIFSTGTILYGANARGALARIDDLDDALSHLRRMQAVGAFSVKSYNQPRREQRQQVQEAARQLGMMVVPEGGATLMANLTQVVDGHTGVEHNIPVAHAYDDVIQLWSATRVGYTPTLGVAYGGLAGERYWYAHTDVWNDPRLLSFVPRWMIDPVARRRELAPDEEYNHVDAARFAKRLVDAGGSVQLGAHGQREGLAAHWELWMFEQGGMTPHEALRAGTLAGARYLGLDGDLGSLEPGKLADFAVIDGNPLADLRQSRHVDLTSVGGRVFDAATMNPVYPAGPARHAFWWEEEGTALPTAAPPGNHCGCGHP